jgi:hypothetical protein
VANADRQVVFGGQRLGRAEDGVCVAFKKGSVRVRAPGVNTEQNRHMTANLPSKNVMIASVI